MFLKTSVLKTQPFIFSFRQSAARQMNLVTIYDIQNKFVGKLNEFNGPRTVSK